MANLRNTREKRIANDYTYRQLEHIAVTYAKDKFMVVSEIVGMFYGDKRLGHSEPSGEDDKGDKGGRRRAGARRLPSWYRPTYRRGARVSRRVVDLDGPMSHLAPFLGKGSLERWAMQRMPGKLQKLTRKK